MIVIGVAEALSETVLLHGVMLGKGSGCCDSVKVVKNGAAVRGGAKAAGTDSPADVLATTVATNPVLCTELSEVNTIVSNEPLDVTADALLPDRVASTGELAEPPSYSRKVS